MSKAEQAEDEADYRAILDVGDEIEPGDHVVVLANQHAAELPTCRAPPARQGHRTTPGECSCVSLGWPVLDSASRGWRGLTMTSEALRLLLNLRRDLHAKLAARSSNLKGRIRRALDGRPGQTYFEIPTDLEQAILSELKLGLHRLRQLLGLAFDLWGAA